MGALDQLITALAGRSTVECKIGARGMATVSLARDLSRLTSNGSGIRPLGWSRDGRDIGYLTLAERGGRTTTLDADRRITWLPWDLNGPARSLHVESKERVEDASVSSAGDLIAVRVLGYGTPGDILMAPVDSPRVAIPFVATTADEETPRFSPDGRLLAYASDETGDFEVYVRPASGTGGRAQVSVGGGAEPLWAHDGSGLYYRSPTHMIFAALDARAEVARRDTLFADVFRKEIRAIAYDVFPGGQQFLMQRYVTAGSGDLNVILNWPELARRRAAAQTVAR